jgi:alkanesulfonate monooxygenase SsuD/methylene tetrahydromethanopterin reductase-like flavin-dependent oxidoreductase (luciferase family)
MAMTMMRFNWVLPEEDPVRRSEMYKAALEMATYGEQHGFAACTFEEHHGSADGWSPTPLMMAGMVLARTQQMAAMIVALLVPLHDPLRIAEDIAVIDLASGGRLNVVGGIGYIPHEYARHGKDWASRGKLMDEAVDTMLKAWSGEPFEYRGTTVRGTPRPLTQPHPPFSLGGTSKVAARRAARFGLPFFPAANLPDLESYYYEQCMQQGTQGFCMMPGEETIMLFVAEDPDKAWADIGPNLLYEATTYHSWQTADIKSSVHSHASTTEELRKEGIYQIITPDEAVERAKAAGDAAAFNLHPMCGGIPVDKAWEHLQLFVDQVLTRF